MWRLIQTTHCHKIKHSMNVSKEYSMCFIYFISYQPAKSKVCEIIMRVINKQIFAADTGKDSSMEDADMVDI